jgi:hypothetical protein
LARPRQDLSKLILTEKGIEEVDMIYEDYLPFIASFVEKYFKPNDQLRQTIGDSYERVLASVVEAMLALEERMTRTISFATKMRVKMMITTIMTFIEKARDSRYAHSVPMRDTRLPAHACVCLSDPRGLWSCLSVCLSQSLLSDEQQEAHARIGAMLEEAVNPKAHNKARRATKSAGTIMMAATKESVRKYENEFRDQVVLVEKLRRFVKRLEKAY